MIEDRLDFNGFKCRAIFNKQEGIPVIFLHGYSFTSEVWGKVNAFELLEENAIPFLALDMPYGLKSECKPKTRSSERNINLVQEALSTIFRKKKAVIVGASLGGNITLRYSMKYPVEGMLLIAPVRGLTGDLVTSYKALQATVYIIYGTKDRIVTHAEMEKLEESMSNAKLFVYKGANHPAYLDKPNDFKKHLLELYENITS